MPDKAKFKALIHYVCAQAPSLLSLGATKLNKILWFAERDCYLRGEPLSQVPFIKLQLGPVPSGMENYLDELQSDGILKIRDTEWRGKPKREFISLVDPNLEGFSRSQISLINLAIQSICLGQTAKSISDISHDEVWELARIGEEIPYYAAFGKRGEIGEEDIVWASQQLRELSMEAP